MLTPTETPSAPVQRVPIVEMRNIQVAFGGVRAVAGVTIDLHPGEVVGVVGGNGAGKTTLMRTLSGARPPDAGQILVNGQPVTIGNPRDAKALGIETIYQTLALADNLDAPANVFLGRELSGGVTLNDAAMESATRKVIGRLNPNFKNFKSPVLRLSGGQRQAVAIARAIHFNARALIMDEPTAALGPAETAQVPLPIVYKGVRLDAGHRLDLLVEELVIVEVKSVEVLEPIHEAQLLTYLRLSQRWLGLLVNC